MGFTKCCAVFGALVLISCGSPAELDEETFPNLNDTGYGQTATGAGGSTQSVVPGGGAAGSGSPVASAGSTGAPSGVAGSTGAPSGVAGSGNVGAAGSGNVGGAGSGGMMMPGGCPSDITVLFARPAAQGGCTSGGGCHEAGSATKPDLISPGVASRLLNVASTCSLLPNGMSVQPRPYISATDSFLEEKITTGVEPGCGFPMPLLMDYALSATDRQCIINWIDQVAAGGG